MLSKVLATIGLLIFGALIPVLEISDTHVFNETWPPHARLHEVWQLSTNIALAVLGLWLVWVRGDLIIAGLIGTSVMGGVLVAHLLSGYYGGALTYEGGLDAEFAGLHVTEIVPLLAIILFVSAIILAGKGRSGVSRA
jgi:uncharacterized membrane protein